MKIKIHSIVDLITNSSTTIFTYSEGSLQAVKDLMNEILKTFDRTETFDDLFYAEVLPDEYDDSQDVPENYKELEIQYIMGQISKPDWMENICFSDGYSGSTSLHLIPKDEKYAKLSNQLLEYLYSTTNEATYD